MTQLSLSELQVIAKRATRGAGYPWGYAEDAGWIVHALSSYHLPALRALYDLLIQGEEDPAISHAIRFNSGVWRPAGSWVSGLITGAALFDRGAELLQTQALTIERVVSPLLVVAALEHIAKRDDVYLRARWEGALLECSPLVIRFDDGAFVPKSPQRVVIEQISRHNVTPRLRGHKAGQPLETPDGLCDLLEELVYRTYVPTSDASRKGAGE